MFVFVFVCPSVAYRLQLQSRFCSCRDAAEPSRRAKMRWTLLKDCIRADWWRFANGLEVPPTTTVICNTTDSILFAM
jgi:hypothetical protein